MFGVPGEGALVDRDIDRERERDETAAATAAMAQSKRAVPAGATTAVSTIKAHGRECYTMDYVTV